MNAVYTQLAWTLIHFVWEGAGIALILAGLLRIVSPARPRYALACGAMLAMVAAFGVTLTWEWPSAMSAPVAANFFWARVQPAPDGLAREFQPASSRLSWLAAAWILGVALFSMRSLAGWIGVRKLRRAGVVPASEVWRGKVEELSERLGIGKAGELIESSLTEVPIVIGFLRPVILMPIGMLAGFPPEQIESFLIHELAHVRRWDYLVNVLQNLVENFLFYHPAVWWVSSVIRAERENCCDDVVAEFGNARGFAQALARLEQSRFSEPALAANGGRLANRIRRLLGKPEAARPTAGPVVSVAILLASIAVAVGAAPKPHVPVIAQVQSGSLAALDQPWARPYRMWLNEEAVYIISDAEKKAFQSLRTEEELQHFIEQFWQRRDPTPGTPENEYREEHYRRIAYVNEHFGYAITPGWRSDRGAIYIKFGPPEQAEAHSGGTYSYPTQTWHYPLMEGIGRNVIIQFVDTAGDGEYHMTLDPNGGPARRQ